MKKKMLFEVYLTMRGFHESAKTEIFAAIRSLARSTDWNMFTKMERICRVRIEKSSSEIPQYHINEIFMSMCIRWRWQQNCMTSLLRIYQPYIMWVKSTAYPLVQIAASIQFNCIQGNKSMHSKRIYVERKELNHYILSIFVYRFSFCILRNNITIYFFCVSTFYSCCIKIKLCDFASN